MYLLWFFLLPAMHSVCNYDLPFGRLSGSASDSREAGTVAIMFG